MAEQKLFACAVEHYLPSAIPTSLERLEEFELGTVLHYRKKPKTFMPWRKNELHFSGCSLASLLEEGQDVQFTSMSNFLFDAGADSPNAPIDAHPDLCSALEELNVTSDKKLFAAADMGRITHVVSDLFDLLSVQQLKVNLSHPVVREAMSKGETIFVISTLYQAEHCSVRVGEVEAATNGRAETWKEGEQQTCFHK